MDMMHRLTITRADDEIRTYMGGTAHNIPIIEFGPPHYSVLDLSVHSTLLTRAEQRAWLLRLSDAVASLALLIPAEAEVLDDGTDHIDYATAAGQVTA